MIDRNGKKKAGEVNHHFFRSGIIAGIAIIFLAYAGPAESVHKGAGGLTCGGCHTMHNSQGASPLNSVGPAGGSMILLRANVSGRQEIHKLCLQCHSNQGVQADTQHKPHGQVAPKVHNINDDWNQDKSIHFIGAGGNFYPELNDAFSLNTGEGWTGSTVAQGKGHSLGMTQVTPPGGDQIIDAFSCTSCHDPHGTDDWGNTTINKYRNLKVAAYKAGSNSNVKLDPSTHTSWVGGVNGTNFTPVNSSDGGSKIWPIAAIAGEVSSSQSNSYGGGENGISRWCAQCHDNWHERIISGNYEAGGREAQGDWNRHPVDNILDETCSNGSGNGCSGAGVDIFDNSNYDPSIVGAVLPVAVAQGSERVFYIQDATQDRVMCLSCHFAHGGPYNDNLRWDYTSAVGSGTQTGNPVPSNRGCQLCHNR